MSYKTTKSEVSLKKFTPLSGNIFVTDLEEGSRITRGGIILNDDNMKESGIRPRWGRVAYIADDIDYLKVGEWVLMMHGRWTNRIVLNFENGKRENVWKIDSEGILLVSDNDFRDKNITHG